MPKLRDLKKEDFSPLWLSLGVFSFDQITKYFIVKVIPQNTVYWSTGPEEFFRLIHVRNLGTLFSLFHDLSSVVRIVVLILFPVALLGVVVKLILISEEFTRHQKWCLAGILGGGIGNILDRIFRPDGVVDFLDFRFYGLFKLERWPTFNVADASVVVFTILLFLSLLSHSKEQAKDSKK